jgi:predicted RNA-binding protein with PIN domain
VTTLYVDAMNVIGTRPDGWWRDRDGAVVRLVERLRAYAGVADVEVVVVVDGRPIDVLPAGGSGAVEVVYADRRGPDAADDRLVELLRERAAPGPAGGVTVVTADRVLRERVTSLGAAVLGPRSLLERLDEAAG